MKFYLILGRIYALLVHPKGSIFLRIIIRKKKKKMYIYVMLHIFFASNHVLHFLIIVFTLFPFGEMGRKESVVWFIE